MACVAYAPLLIRLICCLFFFFNDTPTTEIYTLSLHDALPISMTEFGHLLENEIPRLRRYARALARDGARSEEHTSELQSRQYLVCRLLLEKKKKTDRQHNEPLYQPLHTWLGTNLQ